jgi:hypothetical protein
LWWPLFPCFHWTAHPNMAGLSCCTVVYHTSFMDLLHLLLALTSAGASCRDCHLTVPTTLSSCPRAQSLLHGMVPLHGRFLACSCSLARLRATLTHLLLLRPTFQTIHQALPCWSLLRGLASGASLTWIVLCCGFVTLYSPGPQCSPAPGVWFPYTFGGRISNLTILLLLRIAIVQFSKFGPHSTNQSGTFSLIPSSFTRQLHLPA